MFAEHLLYAKHHARPAHALCALVKYCPHSSTLLMSKL